MPRPGVFSSRALAALDASEGRRRQRKRDTTPDAIGLAIKRDLLTRAAEDDPEPEDFEGWLFTQAISAPAGGPVRALCAEILSDYRLASLDPAFDRWLAEGAYSDDVHADSAPDPLGGGMRDAG